MWGFMRTRKQDPQAGLEPANTPYYQFRVLPFNQYTTRVDNILCFKVKEYYIHYWGLKITFNKRAHRGDQNALASSAE
jgi:hypothetical protein